MRITIYLFIIFIFFSCKKNVNEIQSGVLQNQIQQNVQDDNMMNVEKVDMKSFVLNNEFTVLIPDNLNDLSKDDNNYFFLTNYNNLIVRISWLDNRELGFRNIEDVSYDLDDIVNSNLEDYSDFKFISKEVSEINGIKFNMFKFESNYFFKEEKKGYKEMYSFVTQGYYYTLNISYTKSTENIKNEILNSLKKN